MMTEQRECSETSAGKSKKTKIKFQLTRTSCVKKDRNVSCAPGSTLRSDDSQ
jgi:hypothetical protein